MKRSITLAGVVFALVTVAFAAGCDGGDDEKAVTTTEEPGKPRDAEKAAREQATRRIREDAKRRREAKRKGEKVRRLSPRQRASLRRRNRLRSRRRAATLRRRDRAQDREFDREFDRGFRESAFDKLVARLPIRKPPLYVQQYITTSGSHRVYTAVSRRRFLCRSTPAQRRRAVARFYRDARRVMRAGRVDDFEQVVTVASQTTQKLTALAQAKGGRVALTGPGRERNPC
jgi:hypothetical protein